MKKERLLEYKKNERDNMIWYLSSSMTDEELKSFSVAQLKLISEITKRAEKNRENKSPFYTLSATEVLHKESGKIAEFVQGKGYRHIGVREKSEEEILNGAARTIYKNYINKSKEL